eukprot:324120-Hanusia_phi.AAC.1
MAVTHNRTKRLKNNSFFLLPLLASSLQLHCLPPFLAPLLHPSSCLPLQPPVRSFLADNHEEINTEILLSSHSFSINLQTGHEWLVIVEVLHTDKKAERKGGGAGIEAGQDRGAGGARAGEGKEEEKEKEKEKEKQQQQQQTTQ